MYINFWYPVCTTDELSADAPLPVRLLGQRLAVFRDSEGKPHVLSDTCIHRGGSLGHGKVNGDCIECPYHGWQFDADGKCQLMPSEDGMKPPARAKVDSYPTEERYGVVFAFLGDLPENERPPLYEIEEFDSDEWRPSAPIVLNANCYYERSVENGIDPVHNQFVHPAQGYPPMHKETFRTWDNEWGTGFDAYFGDPVLENTVLAKDRNVTGELKAGSWFHGPNVLITSIFVNAASNLVQYLFEAPIDRDRTGSPPFKRSLVNVLTIACITIGTPAMTYTVSIWKPWGPDVGFSIRTDPSGTRAIRRRDAITSGGASRRSRISTISGCM